MATSMFQIKNTQNRQVIVYTDAGRKPEGSFPLGPKVTKSIELDENQVAYIRQNYAGTITLI